MIKEQQDKVEAIDEELNEIRRRLDRLWQAVETTDLEINDILGRIREHKERQEKLEMAADEARAILAVRVAGLGDEDTIAAYVKEMSDFLMENELTETRAFIRSFVKEIGVAPGKATISYTILMPKDSPIKGRGRTGNRPERPGSVYSNAWWATPGSVGHRYDVLDEFRLAIIIGKVVLAGLEVQVIGFLGLQQAFY